MLFTQGSGTEKKQAQIEERSMPSVLKVKSKGWQLLWRESDITSSCYVFIGVKGTKGAQVGK